MTTPSAERQLRFTFAIGEGPYGEAGSTTPGAVAEPWLAAISFYYATHLRHELRCILLLFREQLIHQASVQVLIYRQFKFSPYSQNRGNDQSCQLS